MLDSIAPYVDERLRTASGAGRETCRRHPSPSREALHHCKCNTRSGGCTLAGACGVQVRADDPAVDYAGHDWYGGDDAIDFQDFGGSGVRLEFVPI